MDDETRQRYERKVRQGARLADARRFLREHVHAAPAGRADEVLVHLARVDPATARGGAKVLDAVLAIAHEAEALAHLVGVDANQDLDDPSDERARRWLVDARDLLLGELAAEETRARLACEDEPPWNLWVQHEDSVVTWFADLTSVRDEPQVLLRVLGEILAAGAAEQVFVLDGPPPMDVLRDRWEVAREIDWRSLRRRGASARLATYDEMGRIDERLVREPGALLRGLLPEEDLVSSSYMEIGSPAFDITGPRLRYAEGVPRGDISLGFETQSDVWFPFISGAAHPWCDHKRYFDNRALASRHTPRLNRFLATAQAVILAVGGTWRLEAESSPRTLLPWIGADRIRLDGPVPALMPPEATGLRWQHWREYHAE